MNIVRVAGQIGNTRYPRRRSASGIRSSSSKPPSFAVTFRLIGSDEMSWLLNNRLIQHSEVTAGYPSACCARHLGSLPVGNAHMLGNYEQIRNSAWRSEERCPTIQSEPLLGKWERSNLKEGKYEKRNQDQSTMSKLLKKSADVENVIQKRDQQPASKESARKRGPKGAY